MAGCARPEAESPVDLGFRRIAPACKSPWFQPASSYGVRDFDPPLLAVSSRPMTRAGGSH
jgi:hypothetical protein